MELQDFKNSTSKGCVIYWDRILIAAAIFLVVIIGCISMIVYVASGSKASSGTTVLAEKKVDGSTFANEPENEPVVEDALPRQLVVYLDAGHGGEDGGSTDATETRIEKDDNLKVSLALKEELEKRGVKVYTTRDEDVFVSLDDRCSNANESKADLFVSLHRNTADVGNGVEIWVSSDEIYEDTLLGENIMVALDTAGISENRGVRFGYIGHPEWDYQVNMDTEMPSCLVELGFISHPEDNELFDENFDKYVLAIADGICKTADDLELLK